MEPKPEAITKEGRKVMIEALPRAVPQFQEPTDNSEKLAKEASRVLGYRGLLTFNAGGKLQAVLENLEIEVLDPKAVFEYQATFGRTEYRKPVIFGDVDVDDDDRDDEEEEDDDEDDDEMPVEASVRGGTGRYYWELVPIQKYAKAIPEFVVRKAIQIKKALPEVQIFIEELQYDPDPFLVVACKNDNFTEQYYVEVWEEPQFEGRLFGATEKFLPKKRK